MSIRKGPVTPSDHFDYVEESALPTTKFFHTYKDKLPMMAIIIDGIYGLTRYDSYDCFQVIRIHCTTSQPRVVGMTEKEANMLGSTFITLPVNTNIRYRVVRTRKDVTAPMLMSDILKKFPFPLLVRMDPNGGYRTIKVGGTSCSVVNFGDILLVEEYKEHYLKLNCMQDASKLQMVPIACMLCLNDEITLTPITGFKHRTQHEYERFVKQLDDQASKQPSQYDRSDGDPNFGEHQILPNEPQKDGRAIPIRLTAAEALKLIRSFKDAPLPAGPSIEGPKPKQPLPTHTGGMHVKKPPRPPPVSVGRSLSSDLNLPTQVVDDDEIGDYEEVDPSFLPAIPPKRIGGPKHLNEPIKSTAKAPVHKATPLPVVEDDDESPGDYEYPGDYESPETSPRSPQTLTSPGINKGKPPVSIRDAKLMDELTGKLRNNLKAGSDDTSIVSGVKKVDDNKRMPERGMEVHERESNNKSGYVNTNIGRALVRPQQQLPVGCDNKQTAETDSATYDDVIDTGSVEDNEDDEYIVMAEVDLPPISPKSPQPKQTTTIQQKPSTGTNPIGQSSGIQGGDGSNVQGVGTTFGEGNNVQADGTTFEGVKGLSISELAGVLHKLKLNKYVKEFAENSIDGEILSDLTVDDLMKELNMKKLEAIRLEKYVRAGHVPK